MAAEHAFIVTAQELGAALGVGLLIGLERGWRDRELPEGGRVAGLRTFGLIGLLGGALAVADTGPLPFAAGLAAVGLMFAASYRRAAAASGTLSITSAVAALVTFVLGGMAASGQPIVAVGAAVVVALLLDLKGVLHRWLRRIEPEELNALLQLGVLSAVVLPALPDRGMGPYGSINPFRTWLAVILIAGLSLSGHVASRLRGERQGLLWVGLLGGLASSTAATLSLARTARTQPRLAQTAAVGILAACAVMFLRMAVIVSALQPGAGARLMVILVLLAALTSGVAAWRWRVLAVSSAADPPPAAGGSRVFDLPTAVFFGGTLALVSLLAHAAKDSFGPTGVYAVAFFSGFADVDAVTISSLQMAAAGQLTPVELAAAVLLAAAANLLSKAAMSWLVGGAAVGRVVAGGYLLVLLGGAALVAAASLL